MGDDHELLRRYGARAPDAQAAFTALVQRHLDLVYSVALRIVRSPPLAEDVAQSVFLDLARQAARVPADTPLVAWLHVVTRRAAIDAVRHDARRRAREGAAAVLAATPSTEAAWTAVEPLLDEAVASLPPADRTAILLRFFENKSLREVGTALGASEDAAQKRVARALDQLRDFFARRGVAVSAATLGTDLSANAILIAPAGLGSAVTASVLAGTGAAVAPIAMNLAQKTLLASAIAALVGVVAYTVVSRPTPTGVATPATPAPTFAPLPASEPRTASRAAAARFSPGSPEDLRVTLLRQLSAELPAQNLPELRLLDPSDWQAIARAHDLDTAADIRAALAELRAVARKKIAALLREALRRFLAASGDVPPADITQLASHLAPPADAAMLARYAVARSTHPDGAGDLLLREERTSDMILTVGVDTFHLTNNAEFPAAFGESETAAIERSWRAMGSAFDQEMKATTTLSPGAIREFVEGTLKVLEPHFGDSDAVGDTLKEAFRKFAAAHPGATTGHLGQLLPFMKDADKFVAALRPALAQIDYLREHGQPATDPALLGPYLDKPFDPAEALSVVKLTWDGESFTAGYSWTIK